MSISMHHHGDGVFYAFEDDLVVWIADIHEDGRFLYPGTGKTEEQGRCSAMGTKLNVPLPPSVDDTEFLNIWPAVETHLEKASPEFIILQCGADSLAGDPITHLCLSASAHTYAAQHICHLASRYAHGRLIVLGGGGYNRHNIAVVWCAVVKQLVHASSGVI